MFADDIYVLYNGGLLGVNKCEASKEFIGRLMLAGESGRVMSVKGEGCHEGP